METKLNESTARTVATFALGRSIRIGSKSKVEIYAGGLDFTADGDVAYLELFLEGDKEASAHLLMHPRFFAGLSDHKVKAETIIEHIQKMKDGSKRK